jgi:hypothetical protein
MNINTDLVFKILSAGLLPAMIWVNSLSVDIALLKRELETNETRIHKVESQQEKILELVKENQISLKSMAVTINFMKDILTDIKNAK